MGSSNSRLSQLQVDLLSAFFERASGFFFTGGAALAQFYLQHRETEDLDLFASPEVDIRSGVQALIDGYPFTRESMCSMAHCVRSIARTE